MQGTGLCWEDTYRQEQFCTSPFLFSSVKMAGTSLAQRYKPMQRFGHPPDSLPALSRDSPEAAYEACPALASQCHPFPAWRPRAGWTLNSTHSSSLLYGAGGEAMAGMLEAEKAVLNKTSCFSHLLPPLPLLPSNRTAANCLLPGVPSIPTLLLQGEGWACWF